VGFVMALSNYGFLAALLALFVAGSKVTAWRSSYKKKFEADFKEGCHLCGEIVRCRRSISVIICVTELYLSL